MSDDEDFIQGPSPPTGQWQRIIAESARRAEDFLRDAPRCDRCGRSIASRGRQRHYLCETDTIIGQACTCRPGCSNTHWGNGAVECDPGCVPCETNQNQPLPGRGRSR